MHSRNTPPRKREMPALWTQTPRPRHCIAKARRVRRPKGKGQAYRVRNSYELKREDDFSHATDTAKASRAPNRQASHHSRSSGMTGWDKGITDFLSLSLGRAFLISGRRRRRRRERLQKARGIKIKISAYLLKKTSLSFGGWVQKKKKA